MLKKSIGIAAIIATFAMATPVFATTSGLLLPAVQKISDTDAAISAGGPGGGPHVKRESSAPSVSEKIACVGAAIVTRETALDAGVMAHAQSVQAAYTTRATALKQAYSATTTIQLKGSVKASWSVYSSSIKSATKTWKTTQANAWTAFKVAAKNCNPPAGVSDSFNSSAELTGQ